MTKYEKILKDDENKLDKVLAVLKVLDGEKFDDAKEILDAAKFFVSGSATFNQKFAENWIESIRFKG